jgi:hypothetical protein
MGRLWATCPSALDVLTDGERSRSASATAAEHAQDSKILPFRPLGRSFAFLQTGVPLARFFRDAGAALFSVVGPDGFAARQRKVLLTSLFGADYGNFS